MAGDKKIFDSVRADAEDPQKRLAALKNAVIANRNDPRAINRSEGNKKLLAEIAKLEGRN